jgi:hypothetical protein
MKKITFQIITFAFVFCLTGFAQASLIGDEVIAEFDFPFFGTLNPGSASETLIVEAGTGDVIRLHFDTFEVNVEESSVIVDFLQTRQFENLDVYDFAGLALYDLDDSEPGYILLGVDVDTNMAGWDESRIMFGDDRDSVGFNWQGLTVNDNTDFTAFFEFGPNPIPIPATLLLFVSGIAGFTLIRRKITK